MKNVYVPWVPHTAHKLLTPGHRSGDPWPPGRDTPPPAGQSPEKFVYVYVPFPFLNNGFQQKSTLAFSEVNDDYTGERSTDINGRPAPLSGGQRRLPSFDTEGFDRSGHGGSSATGKGGLHLKLETGFPLPSFNLSAFCNLS